MFKKAVCDSLGMAPRTYNSFIEMARTLNVGACKWVFIIPIPAKKALSRAGEL